MNFIQFHIGDWVTGTRLMSAVEKGVYMDLLMFYYNAERPISQEECKRIARAYAPEEQKAMQYVLDTKFVLDGDCYRNNKCDEVIADYRSVSEKRSRAARARWGKASTSDAKDMQEQCTCNANEMLTINHKPITNISTVQSNDCTREKNFFTLDSEPNADLKKQNCPTSEIVEIFNEVLAPELGRVKKLTSTRAQLVRARWHDVIDVTESKTRADALAGFRAYFEKVGRSDFLMGRLRDATWKADFDWLIKSENFVKVFENRYQNGR